MKTTCAIVPALPEHAHRIARDARPADVAEIAAASGKTCLEAMLTGMCLSDKPLTGLINETPVCMFGIAPRSRVGCIGVPWMVASRGVEQHPMAFLRRSKSAFYPLAAPYALLVNYVDMRNELAIRWLRWLGFEFEAPKPYGVAGLPFHRFYMEA